MSLFLFNLQEHTRLVEQLHLLDREVQRAIDALTAVLASGGKLLLCGNGGSAADCQHIAAEFVGRFMDERRPLPAISLSTDTSALTCIGNDYSFDAVFSRQVRALGTPKDALIAISTSGNSSNVVKAVEAAREIGMLTLGLSGRGGGALSQRAELNIVVPHEVTARIQEAHILIGHTLCGGVEQQLGLVPKTAEKRP
ncbi:MAG: D-sedoheptulose 7-phosphate isomerase [Ideonella sp. WA131b]|jgi:D-sedoheptulose 7-phosphate isomerase|nr:D-sedoheptulose 7-phosphate isomerase [Ideonella sp. WA131b]